MRGKKGKKRRKLCNPDERQIFFHVSFASWAVLFLTKEILSEAAAWEFFKLFSQSGSVAMKTCLCELKVKAICECVCVCVVLELFLTHQMCTEIKSSGSFCLTVLSRFPFNVFVLSWHWLDKAPPSTHTRMHTQTHTHTQPPHPPQKNIKSTAQMRHEVKAHCITNEWTYASGTGMTSVTLICVYLFMNSLC